MILKALLVRAFFWTQRSLAQTTQSTQRIIRIFYLKKAEGLSPEFVIPRLDRGTHIILRSNRRMMEIKITATLG